MNKHEYNDNFDLTEKIECEVKFTVKLYVYTDTREHSVNGKWQHADPVKESFDFRDIRYFREQNESDNYNNDCLWIMDSTVMPTKWCMMIYYDKFARKQKIIPVVGSPKELNEMLDSLNNRWHKANNRLDKLHDKIKDLYLFSEVD